MRESRTGPVVDDPPKPMRERMPPNYLPILRLRTGKGDALLSKIVTEERTQSPTWPEVVKLAEEHEAEQAQKATEGQASE